MRVIAEERLKEWLKHVDDLCIDDTWWIEDDINQYMQEIDTLTVSKLRPMSDLLLDNNERVLAWHIEEPEFLIVSRLNSTEFTDWALQEEYGDMGLVKYQEKEFAGWIPIPNYKPE